MRNLVACSYYLRMDDKGHNYIFSCLKKNCTTKIVTASVHGCTVACNNNTYVIEYYSTPNCYTEQNPVLFSTRVSVLFSIFVVLGVVLTDTKRGSVLLSIFSDQF
jgi:hypothetical protein